MSSHPIIALAYCADDQDLALTIEKDLGTMADFRHFTADSTKDGPVLSEAIESYQGFVLLLITDNFLRCPNCILHGNRLLSGSGRETLVILADSRRHDPLLEEWVEAPVRLERQADVMQYINHWQERYLDLRRQSRELSEEAGPAFDRYLGRVREVSGQVNDFLHYLKDGVPLRWREFVANHYQQFFIFTEQTDKHGIFASTRELSEEISAPQPEEPPVDLSAIPGMDLLPEDATEAELEETEIPEADPVSTEPEVPVESLLPPDLPEDEPTVEAEAIPLEMKEVRDEPSEAEEALVYIRRAWALAEDGNLNVAFDLLDGAREALPENPDIRYHHALMLATEALDPLAARREIDALLAEHPDHPDALFLSGELYNEAKQYGRTRETWEHLVDVDPDYPDLNRRLGLLIADHNPEDAFDAAAYLRRAAKEEEATAETLYRYALLLANDFDKAAKARKVLTRALDIDPDHAYAQYELATLLHANGDTALARAAYSRAKKLRPEFETPENEAAFFTTPNTTIATMPRFMSDAEANTLNALKDNIAQLEAMIQQRETEAAEREAAEEAAKAAAPGHGKTVLITGATAGIGLATARRFAAAGYSLILTGRRNDRLNELKKELKDAHEADVKTLRFDVRDKSAVHKQVEGLPQKWQHIDILINNAGKAKGFDPIHEGDYDHWEEMIDTNLKGLLYMTRAVSPGMVERKDGMIINVCSTAGKEVYPKGNVYCATKHAVDALTQGMRLDLVEHGVRVGQVCPAHVEETEFALVRFDGDAERAEKVYDGFQPLTSLDVAETIFWMATQPPHVNVLDVVLQGKQQASSTVVDRSGR